ncbi:HIT family protein [Alphaproteobacteria bacterium KMM 3653]|uniref:HIT family protein n=1 Tax=Harenicola maris TaxID=2841044 RepID=A0AAP2G774_9RHOB|nr:HIT family protein [Harenicola maris]
MTEGSLACRFCEIATGKGAAHIAWQTRALTVFADHAPIRPGHVQIIPRAHYPFFDDLPEALAAQIITLGQRIARVQKAIYGVKRVGFVFTGHDVAHCHAHVIPLHRADDVTSMRYFEAEALPKAQPRVVGAAEQAAAARELAHALALEGVE